MKTERHSRHHCLHLGLEIVKIGLKVAAVTVGFKAVKELHKIHENLEERKHHHLLPHLGK